MTLMRALFFAVLFAPAALAQTWAVQPTPTANNLNDVYAVSTTEAYAVGEVGVLLRTTNGGATWSQITLGNNDLQGIEFNGSGVGLIATDAGPVYRTTNGTTWSLIGTGSAGNLRDVAWGTSSVVWSVSREGDALRSADAGLTWSVLPTGATERLLAMDAVGANEAWVVGEAGTILHTTNSGATWTPQPSGTAADLKGIQMLSASTGFVVGSNNTVRMTTDGGASWTNVSNGNAGGDGLFFLDASTGWVVDNNGLIWFTANGGATWVIQPSGTNVPLSRVHFANAGAGWAVGDAGVVTAFTGPAGGGVTVTMTPVGGPVTIPATGGSFQFTITLTNTGTTAATVQAWTAATGPAAQSPAIGPQTVTLPAGASVSRTLSQAVPGNAPAGTYTYSGNVGTFPGTITDSDSFPVVKASAASEGLGAPVASAAASPEGYALSEVYPNPFNPQARFTLSVGETQAVTVAVYDALGRRVALLHEGLLDAGSPHAFTLEGASWPTGTFVVRIVGETFASVRRVTLLR